MKALGLVVSNAKIFENCILKTHLLTLLPTYATNLLRQPTGTVKIILVGDHLGIIPVIIGQNTTSGFREVV